MQADRAEQALELLALDPVSETLADRCSYGFRQGRSAQDAMAACFQALCQQTSAEWILEGDIRGCFDHLDQEWLVDRLPTHKGRLRAWLKAGYLERKVFHPTAEGTPQGGPLSPLHSNVVLDELDRELARRGHRFVRYADDCNIYVRSRAAAERVMASTQRFIEKRMRLKVNEAKSAADLATNRQFLGFSFY